MRWIKRIVLAVAVLFLAAQFVRPDFSNPPVDPRMEYRAPAHIQPILDRACNDCHSNRTRWPWYSRITPVSWWLKDHVQEGRHELSFSEFHSYAPKKAAHKMEEVCDVLKKGEMPPSNYLWMHREARLSDADKRALCEWSHLEQRRLERSP